MIPQQAASQLRELHNQIQKLAKADGVTRKIAPKDQAPAAEVIELYSIRDVSRIFAIPESRLRYWMQTGFVGPTVRQGGRFYYRFADIVAVKAAKDLLAAGLPLQKIRKNLEALRKVVPLDANPSAKLRICSDGETIVAIDEDIAFSPTSGQVVMAFTVPGLGARVAEVLSLPNSSRALETETAQLLDEPAHAVPLEMGGDNTEANANNTAYRKFLDGCAAEAAGQYESAEHLFALAIAIEPSMAAAHTNLGNMLYRRGSLLEARNSYERSLEFEPDQAEARYNLANVYEDMLDHELAIAQLRQVCATHPTFADAHYNLGLLLVKIGAISSAKEHLQKYVELDGSSEWTSNARDVLQLLNG